MSNQHQTKKPGISFILRARNEESYLAQSLASLLGLTVPYEIVVILHKCTDQSKAIALDAQAKGQPIRIYETDANLSKAGYETLATPAKYNESLASFYSQCFSFGQYNWLFKWDADFVASSELLTFLNSELVLDLVNPFRYLIPCQMSEDIINKETYLFNCLVGYKKYIFWETPAFFSGSEIKEISARIFTIPHTILKEYWKEPPWFIGINTFLEDRYKKIVELCGPEPVGASRAQCKDCEGPYFRVLENKLELEGLGIILIE
jgi:glycosyltransferase involved in cell wall biosynthesis